MTLAVDDTSLNVPLTIENVQTYGDTAKYGRRARLRWVLPVCLMLIDIKKVFMFLTEGTLPMNSKAFNNCSFIQVLNYYTSMDKTEESQ